ncbi:response regulator transcription factor [Actinoplanes sp. NPDC051494]|uniref:response regulator transcription factor n=1 Tax=Actinoplanes sp. NPDC051494 TaxID=3363907 RepID=UPI003787606B
MTYVDPNSRAVRIHVRAHDPVVAEGVVDFLRGTPAVVVTSAPDGGPADLLIVVAGPVADEPEPPVPTGVPTILIVEPAPLVDLLRLIAAYPVVAVLSRATITQRGLIDLVGLALSDRRHLETTVLPAARAIAVEHDTGAGAGAGTDRRRPWLSDRERAVLRLMAEGYETDEVAEKLNYSARTIKNILRGVTLRAGLHSRTHAVAWAIREGLI